MTLLDELRDLANGPGTNLGVAALARRAIEEIEALTAQRDEAQGHLDDVADDARERDLIPD